MLFSHRYGFLFIHIAKTGGTSVRAALHGTLWTEPSYWATRLSHGLSRWYGHRLGTTIPRHAPVIVAREMLPPQTFARLFKFAFIRNPWDRLVSAYGHYQRERQDILTRHNLESFSHFVDFVLTTPAERAPRSALMRAIQRPQLESLIGLRGELLVDFIGRYESLAEDFHDVAGRLSLPTNELPHKRRGTSRRDYRECYTVELAERVGEHYADDLAAFQYHFDPCLTPLGREHLAAGQRGIAGKLPAHDDQRCWGGADAES
jgi:hypothetical protein